MKGLNSGKPLSDQETALAVTSALELIGNASARIARMRQEKLTTSLNKSLLPLAQDDKNFMDAAPNSFGSEFARKSKDYLDQVKALRTSLSSRRDKPFFRSGPPNGRRGYSRKEGRGGPPSFRRGMTSDRSKHFAHRQQRQGTQTQRS